MLDDIAKMQELKLPKLSGAVTFGPAEYVNGRVMCLVKNNDTGRYFRSGVREVFILERLDGTQTAPQVARAYQQAFGTVLSVVSFEGLLRSLSQGDLLHRGQVAAARPAALGADSSISRLLSPFTFKLVHWDPDLFFSRFSSKFRWLASVQVLMVWALVIAGVEGLLIPHLGAIWHACVDAPMGMIPLRVLTLFVIYSVMTMLHEAGHAIACKAYGGAVPEMGYVVKYLLPFAYTKIDDILMFPKRADRICALAIGPLISLTIIPFAFYVWWITLPGTIENTIAADVLVWYNLNSLMQFVPFLKLDGYFMLAQLLRMPDLMTDSYKYLIGALAPASTGIRPMYVAPECPRYVKPALIVYGCLSILATIAAVSFAIHTYADALFRWLGEIFAIVALILFLSTLVLVFLWKVRQWSRGRQVQIW